ncbi:YDG domain-containing protein [Flavobacterium sp. DGU11]|uniref:YDG domain-containing protein n=1 Tax=Flavobacterium arundinis TaxID=3139143 RepID=A0ABU9HX85_9FLAO
MKLLHQNLLKGLFLMVLFLTATVSWGQLVDEGFEASTAPAGWTMNSMAYSTNNKCSGSRSAMFNANGDYMITPVLGSPGVLTFTWRRSSNSPTNPSFQIGYATSASATTWTSIGTISSFTTSCQTFTYDLTGLSNIYVRVLDNRGGGANEVYVDDFLVAQPAFSSASTIIRNTSFTEPSNIDYTQYQATDITFAGSVHNSMEVAKFDIRDGGTAADADALPTTLTAITFTVANPGPIRKLAIYDGNTEIAEQAVTSTAGSVAVAFSGFSLSAPDGGTSTFGSKTFSLRATFDAAVTDNTQFSFTVNATTEATSNTSKFAADNAGAAASLTTTDRNRIEVTADRLAFVTQPATTNANAAMANVTVSANDANGNRDLDFTSGVKITSTGTLTGSPVSAATVTSGLATFTGLTHTAAGTGFVLTAQRTATSDWSVNSNTFAINKLAQTITFASNITKTYGDAEFDLTATASSGLAVTYTSSDESVATISGSTVIILSNGVTTITASQAGNGVYNAAANVAKTLTVNKKQLSVTGAVAQSKIYDGTPDATITGAVLSGGVVGSDDVTLGSFYIAGFNNKNIGTAKPVDAAFELEGAHASRYTLADPTGLTADITAKELTISGITIADKDFDSDTDATIVGTPVLNGVVGTEDVTLNTSAATAVFANIGPGATIPVTVSGYAVNGNDIANYTLIQPQGLTANINETGLANQTITFGALDAVTYGDATFNLTATASSGLTVTYTSSDENVATVSGNTVTITGAGTTTIRAFQEGNGSFNPASSVPQELVVNKKTITVAGAAVTDKVYNTTTTAVATGTLAGLVGGDAAFVDLTGTGVFASADVANGIAVTTDYSITGTRAYNYELTQPGDLTGNITPATLTLETASAASKIYDGTTATTVSGVLTGILPGDTVTYNGTGTFASAGVATGIAVTSTSTLAGTDAGNYQLAQPTGLTADITAKNLTVTATAGDKEYNRTTAAVITVTGITGLADGDDVTATGGGTFNNFNVGTGKPVTAALSLTGDDAANYTLTQPTGLTAAITAKNLTVTSADVADKAYDGNTNATITNAVLDGIVAGDEADVTIVSGTFAQAETGNNIPVSSLVLSGSAAGNYSLTQPTGLTGNITGMPLTLAGAAAQNKVYDGNNTAVITGTLSGVAPGDDVTFTGTGTFASVAVANGIEVTPLITIGGADAANYTFTQPTGLSANITPKALTVNAVAVTKEYNRTTAAVITVSQINGIVAGDDINVTGGGTFNTFTKGTNKPVTAALVLGGDSAANYTLTQPTGLTADITAKNLTVTSADVVNRPYNGTTAATIENAVIDGIVAGDEADVAIVSGTFAQAEIGTDIPVANLVLSGAATTNYTLTQPTGLTGNITGTTLTLTGAAAQNKVYDSTTAAVITGTLTGVAAGDDVTFTGTGIFASADAANGIEVTPTITLGGADAANYTLTQPTGLTANITPKTLTIAGLTADNKVYDKTTTATLSGTPSLVGILNSDDVSLDGTPVANFNNFLVGTAKPVTVTGYVLADNAANYTLVQPTGLTANITAKPLTMTGGAVTTKTYNTTTAAVVTGVTLVGVEAGDTVTATTGTFASANAGTQNVTVLLAGANAGNYTLTQADPLLTGTINKAPLTVTADFKTRVAGASNPALTITYATFAGSDNAADDADFTPPTLTTTAASGSTVPGAYPITFATPGDADNYTFTYVEGTLTVTGPETTSFGPGTLWTNPITDSNPSAGNPFTTGQTVATNTNSAAAPVGTAIITVSGIGRGSGIGANAAGNRYNANSWNTVFDSSDYFEFTITPVDGYKLNLASFVYTGQASGTGPSSFAFRSSKDGYAGNIGTATASGATISLSGAAYQNLTGAITFRFYGWGSSGSNPAGGTFSINDFSFTGSVIKLPNPAVLPVISNITSGVTTYTVNYGQANASFDVDVNADATPTVTFSAAFPSALTGSASINAATGVITFNDDILPGTYNIPVNAKSYYNTVTTPATNGDTKTLVFKVNKLDQPVTFDTDPNPLPANLQPGDTFTVDYNNPAGLPVTWSTSNGSVATVATNGDGTATVTIVAAGSANIIASNSGDTIYNALNATATALNIRTLTATPGTINLIGYQGQATIAAHLTNIAAANLNAVNGNLTISVTDGAEYFEVSNAANSGFDTTAAYAYSGASFSTSNPAIYVRLKAGLTMGDYTGTMTLSGGGAITTVTLNGTVQVAPVVNTTAAAYGPYCVGTDNNISVAFTTEGGFPAGNFYAQVSDATGNFHSDFSNIISGATAASPINATMQDDLAAGNYRVRVVHLSNGLLLTTSLGDNGSAIVINAKPTLTSVQVAVSCAGTASGVSLAGLLPNTGVTVNYTIGAAANTATVTADAGGNASFDIVLDGANDGQLLTVTSLTRTDVTQSCAAAFSVSATITVGANTWTGAAGTSDWNDENNWSCNTVPTEDIRAIIGAGANQPEISGNTIVSVKTLTIEDGADMVVESGSNIRVIGKVTVQEGGSLTLQNNANLIQVNDVDNSGEITVIKNSAPMYRLDYALWSSPVTGGSLVDFSPQTLSNRFYHYNPISDAYATVPGSTLFNEGMSYLIRVANNHPAYVAGQTGTPWTGTFEGTPNNGDVNVSVMPADGTITGYNAVGNPYPSPINIAAFYAANANNLGDDTSLYFWRKKNDENTSCYASLTLTGYTANNGNAFGDSSNGVFNNPEESDTWVINPGQGFIVQAEGSTISFNNGMRVAVNNNQQFRNAQDAATTGSRLWLNLTGAQGEFHQTLVAYTNNTTLGLDYGWDGKALTDGTVAIYSLIGESKLGIQARPAFDAADVVPMGYKATTAGSYTITLDHVDGLFSQDQDIYLKDNLFGTTHDLKLSAYEFATEAGTFEGRFEVVYAEALGTDIPVMDANSIIVYKQGSNINISSGTTDMTGVTVYDLRGRVLYRHESINAAETVISGLQAQEQMLIVEVTTLKGKVSKKIIF